MWKVKKAFSREKSRFQLNEVLFSFAQVICKENNINDKETENWFLVNRCCRSTNL